MDSSSQYRLPCSSGWNVRLWLYTSGTCPTCRGHVNGSRPAGETSPTSAAATASPPRVPGYQTARIAGTFSCAQRRSSGRPDITTSTTGVPVATRRCSCSSCRPGSSRVLTDAASPIWFWRWPATTITTSDSAASSTAAAIAASSS